MTEDAYASSRDAYAVNLDATEQRVIGALLEKQVTVPASYPLSLNALRTACNQQSSRDPVVDYDDALVDECLKRLRQRELVRVVWESGSRTRKFDQLVVDRLDLSPAERAVVTVLLLRGPQAPGELRTRTDRLHAFADRDEVEIVLAALAARDRPLVRELPRRPGQQDARWIHLLGPVEMAEPAGPSRVPTTAAIDRESVLAAGAQARDARTVAAYEAVAAAYANAYLPELAGKPFDRWLLARIAELAADGPVAEVGCGPGQVAGFLAEQGAEVVGFDISPAMIEQARTAYPPTVFPGLEFELADFTRLLRPRSASGWSAIVAWYAMGHLAESELGPALAALARVLQPGGWLGLAMHAGDEVRHLDSWFDEPVDLDVVLHDPDTVLSAVRAAGLVVHEWYVRGPLPGAEADTRRIYLLAQLPA